MSHSKRAPSRSAQSRDFRLLTWFLGTVLLLVLTAANIPGPWHEEIDLASKSRQCPVCKIAGQGIVETAATAQPAPPQPAAYAMPADWLPAEKDDLFRAHAARAPPA